MLIVGSLNYATWALEASNNSGPQPILGTENFTFFRNGSFIQIDAGREWPFNSKREISFRFRTRSPHGLLIYQTFDHNKLQREDDLEGGQQANKLPSPDSPQPSPPPTTESSTTSAHMARQTRRAAQSTGGGEKTNNFLSLDVVKGVELASSTITATASEKLAVSLISSSPMAAINGNNQARLTASATQSMLGQRDRHLLASSGHHQLDRATSSAAGGRNRLLGKIASHGGDDDLRINYKIRKDQQPPVGGEPGGPTIVSSSTISSLSASLYELYLKLENGRLKIMYEFGSRLNQSYCGKGLNDDRWHRVDLKVDPEINQMVLVLDQVITVEIGLSSQVVGHDNLNSNHNNLHNDENTRRNELVFTNSILYMGGLNNNASIVRNIRQRLYLAQFIGCLGQIMLRTDQQADQSLMLPATIDRAVQVKPGCVNLCDTDNYCLHDSTCVNYYTHTRCDCFGTHYEDVYCWQAKLTTLTMQGYSTLVHRIYDWRDRHHSSINRFSVQFSTLAADSILFFAYGDLSGQANQARGSPLQPTTAAQAGQVMVNISSLPMVHRPSGSFQYQANNNYLAVSLSNGSIVVEVSFGDQPVLISSLLYDKLQDKHTNLSRLADGNWHNVTFTHHNKQISLYLDEHSVSYTILGKNNHIYFDPSIYVGGVPSFLFNETRTLLRPFNLRHKFAGCLRSVYFNQHDLLLALKQQSPMVEYRDTLGKAQLDVCSLQEANSLPLTLRSGKSYLTFQISPSQPAGTTTTIGAQNMRLEAAPNQTNTNNNNNQDQIASRKATRIEFDYKTSLRSHFLAGGHLRDLSYHDLGGFWTLYALDDCQLYFTISSGLTFDPEQVLKLSNGPSNDTCNASSWYRITISILSGDKVLNIARDELGGSSSQPGDSIHESGNYILSSSIELLHQVQLGGDLAKFGGGSSSLPFSGCLKRIRINGNSFDSRDFVTSGSTSSSILPSSLQQVGPQNQSMGATAAAAASHHDLISSRMAQGYVTLESCKSVNPCAADRNPCKNGGVCKVNELGEPDCDCSRSGYTGRRCHFSIYKQSCQDYYLSGQRKSSHYLIDLDRNGPLKPIRVRCDMDSSMGSMIETSLQHNLPPEYFVRRSPTTDLVLDVTYLAFQHRTTNDGFYVQDDDDDEAKASQDLALVSLIDQSLYCKQNFRYECRSSPLQLGNNTWLEVPYPRRHRLASLDSGSTPGRCACASSEKKCLDPQKGCNCDSGESIWSDDWHELTGHQQVAVTRIVLLKQPTSELAQSRLTLGELKCFGSRLHAGSGSEHEITFKTSDAYIEVPGWRRGDLSFSFRTASTPPAIVLYQLATSRNHGYLRLTLMSDLRLLFEFIVNRRPRKLSLASSHKLNNGEWQQVFIEYDSANIRLTVNDDSALVDLDQADHLGTFEGPLFIGGAPSKYLVGDLSKRNGFTGCFRGLKIGGRPVDLNSYLSPSMPTVIGGCQPSCSKDLCQNGGRCIEYWGSYECECQNPIAHSGNNCEINLNTNSITFVTQESHYVQNSNDSLPYPAYLTKNILLNIRTYQETALVLFASDRFNNFIQLHKNGSSMALTFNSNATIVVVQLPINDDDDDQPSASDISQVTAKQNLPETVTPPALTNISHQAGGPSNGTQLVVNMGQQIDLRRPIKASNTSGSGQPIQIKIERHRLRTTFYVNNNFVVIERPLVFLTNATMMSPWTNPELELVRPIRSKVTARIQSRFFLAAVDEYFTTRLPGFTGCIQGLSLVNQLFDFNRAHLTGELRGEYKIGCKMQCDSLPCRNQGTCIENWMEDKIQCKCDQTSYVGRLCDEDIAAIFNGQSSHFTYHLGAKLAPPMGQADASNQSTGSIQDLSPLNQLEVSLAFSSESNSSHQEGRWAPESPTSLLQVLVYITRANSSKHFLLALTPDGSLLIQEDYGNSMSLSRLIKKPEQPFNDGHRHMFRYSRLNQTMQITVDHQAYLPTMSVVTASQSERLSKSSLIFVGTAGDNMTSDTHHANYNGCISNLLIRMDHLSIEPLAEAFGQNLDATINATKKQVDDPLPVTKDPNDLMRKQSVEAAKNLVEPRLEPNLDGLEETEMVVHSADPALAKIRQLQLASKQDGHNMETIRTRDVEQGKCATFKKLEAPSESKRSINEPRTAPVSNFTCSCLTLILQQPKLNSDFSISSASRPSARLHGPA